MQGPGNEHYNFDAERRRWRFPFLTGKNIGLGKILMLPVTGGYIHHDIGI